VRDLIPKRGRPAHELRLTDDGLRLVDVSSGLVIWELVWRGVRQICAWKEDLFVVDLICMGFRLGDESTLVWCDEECNGWDALQERLEKEFQVKAEMWWRRVAFPAFVANWTTVWGEDGTGAPILLARSPHEPGFPVV